MCPIGGKGAARWWGPPSRDGFDSGAGVHREVLNDLRLCIRAGRRPQRHESYAIQTKTKTKGWKPQKVGDCNREQCPWSCNWSHVAQDEAKSRIWRFEPKMGFEGRQNSAKWPKMAHSTPHAGSPTTGPDGQAGAKTQVQGCVWAILRDRTHKKWGAVPQRSALGIETWATQRAKIRPNHGFVTHEPKIHFGVGKTAQNGPK